MMFTVEPPWRLPAGLSSRRRCASLLPNSPALRKSLAQWLNIAGVPERQLADICGWSIPDRAAMVGYLHTTPQMHMDYKLLIPAVEL